MRLPPSIYCPRCDRVIPPLNAIDVLIGWDDAPVYAHDAGVKHSDLTNEDFEAMQNGVH